MKQFFLFVLFSCLSISLQAQSVVPAGDYVFGEMVPDYLKRAMTLGKVTVNGTQKIINEPVIVPFQPREIRNYGPSLRLHPEAVIFLGARIIGRPEIDDSLCNGLPNQTPSLFGIRGGSETMGGPTAEQAFLNTATAKSASSW